MDLDLDQWRALAQPYYEVFPREPKESAGVTIEVTTVDTLLATKLLAPAQNLVHDPVNQKGICHEYLLFERFYSGGGKGEVGDMGFSLNPDSLHMIDMSQRYVSAQRRSSSRGILIPHAAVGYTPGDDPPVYSSALDSPSGRILAAAHEALWTANSPRPPMSRRLPPMIPPWQRCASKAAIWRPTSNRPSPKKQNSRNGFASFRCCFCSHSLSGRFSV